MTIQTSENKMIPLDKDLLINCMCECYPDLQITKKDITDMAKGVTPEIVDKIFAFVNDNKFKIKVKIRSFINEKLSNSLSLIKESQLNSHILLRWNSFDTIEPILVESIINQNYSNRVLELYKSKIPKKELTQIETASVDENKTFDLANTLFEDYLRQLIDDRNIIDIIQKYCLNAFVSDNGIFYSIIINGKNKGRIFLSEQEIHRFKVKNNTVGYRELYNTIYLRVLESIKDSYKDKLENFREIVSKTLSGEVLSFEPFKPQSLDTNSNTEQKVMSTPVAQKAIELEEEFSQAFPEIKNISPTTTKFPELQEIIDKLTNSKSFPEFKLTPFTSETAKSIPQCSVFDPAKEISELKQQLRLLAKEVNKLKDSISNCGITPTFGK